MIIASRLLKLHNAGTDIEIPVRIFLPEREDTGGWSCSYEIEWPDGKWTMAAHGFDSIQAIDLAFHMIGSEIYTSNYHKSGQLFLEVPGRGYGFPVPKTLRDLLEGDDAKFY